MSMFQTMYFLRKSVKFIYLTWRYAILRYAILRYAILRYAILRYAILRYAILRYAMLRYGNRSRVWTTPTPEGLVLYYINRIVASVCSLFCSGPIYFLTVRGTDMRFFAKVDKFIWLRPKTKIIFAGPLFDPLFGPKPDAIWEKH